MYQLFGSLFIIQPIQAAYKSDHIPAAAAGKAIVPPVTRIDLHAGVPVLMERADAVSPPVRRVSIEPCSLPHPHHFLDLPVFFLT